MPFRQKSGSGWVRLLHLKEKLWRLECSWTWCLFPGTHSRSKLKLGRSVQSSSYSAILEARESYSPCAGAFMIARGRSRCSHWNIGCCAVGGSGSRVSSTLNHYFTRHARLRTSRNRLLMEWQPVSRLLLKIFRVGKWVHAAFLGLSTSPFEKAEGWSVPSSLSVLFGGTLHSCLPSKAKYC